MSEELLRGIASRSVLDAFADGIVAADVGQRIVYVNGAAARLLGWGASELVGQPLTRIMPPRLHVAHETGFHRYLATRVPHLIGKPVRVPALRRDGREVEVELNISAFRSDDGADLFVASLRDLSERVELERQLDTVRLVRATTRAATQMVGRMEESSVIEIAVSTLVADFGAALARVWLTDEAGETLILRGSDGISRDVEHSARARVDIASHPYKIGVVARTQTLMVKNGLVGDPQFDQAWVVRDGIAAAAIFPLVAGRLRGVFACFFRRPLHDDVSATLSSFATFLAAALANLETLDRERLARASAEQALEARDEFLSVAAHELRTPTTVLMLNAERMVLAARATAPALERKATAMEHSVRRLARLIETMLDFSRVQARAGQVELEDLDLRAITDEVAALFADLARAAGCTISVDGPAVIHGRWDDLRLRQILTNLLTNAIKYGRGGAVTITLSCEPLAARVAVHDHGIGIAPADQARVFDRFERAVSQRHYGGLGIGLWLVRQNVAALGGTVTVDSAVGEGSTFTVELPRNGAPPPNGS